MLSTRAAKFRSIFTVTCGDDVNTRRLDEFAKNICCQRRNDNLAGVKNVCDEVVST